MSKDTAPSLPLLMLLATVGLLTSGASHRRVAEGVPGAADTTRPGAAKAAVPGSRAGREATSPARIPRRGWWSVIRRTFTGFNDDRLMTEAAGVTFYTLLAIFPALATLVSLYGLFADPATVNDHLTALRGIVPGGGFDILSDEVKSLTSNPSQALGLGLIVGILTSLWSANQGVKALFDALNVVYHEKEKRGYIHRTLLCLAFTLGSICFIIVTMTAVVVVPVVLNFFGFGDWGTTLLAAARWPGLMLIMALALAFIYRYGPSRSHARWRWVSWGSAFASVTWILGSLGFSYYVSNFSSYNKTYGSLGAAVGFMTWIWISSIVVLLGGELNAELEQQTERDTTTGPELPMGQRGAFKADTKA